MRKTCGIGAVFMTLAISATPSFLQAQVIDKVVGGVATGIALEQLFTKLNAVVTKARTDGDYLLGRAGLEAQNAIEAWRKANDKLLDDAFDELDKASRDNFARAQQLVDIANTDMANRLETATQLTENANQIIESIPLGGNQTYVLRYVPRIVPPNTKDTFILRVRGVRLDKGDPELHLTTGTAKRDLIGPQEVQFTVPLSEIAPEEDSLARRSLKITYSTPKESWFARLFGQRDTVTREIPIMALPSKLATYEGTATRKFSKKESKPYQSNFVLFKGENTNIPQIIKPLPGWQWDMGQPFGVVPGQADHGYCVGIDNNASTQDGVSLVGHVDKLGRTITYPNGGPGWTNCALAGTVYQMVPAVETKAMKGAIYWTNDETVDLPSDFLLNLQVSTFDKRGVNVTGIETDKFFVVQRNPESLIIKPKVPEDLVN